MLRAEEQNHEGSQVIAFAPPSIHNHFVLRSTSLTHWRLAIVGSVLLITAAPLIHFTRIPMTNEVLDDACHTPISLIEPEQKQSSDSSSSGSLWYAVVFHGLAANRKVMIPIGQQLARAGAIVYLLDSPGEGDSTAKFSFANNETCVATAVAYLAKIGGIQLDRTVFVGHSLGGEAAVRLADRFPQSAGTIALSPAPMVLPKRTPANLLLLSAQFDPWQLREGVREDLQRFGPLRDSTADFAAHRALGFVLEPLALHGSVLFDPRVLRIMTDWALRSVQMPDDSQISARPETLAMFGGVLGLVGLALMLPLIATLSTQLTGSLRGAGENESSAPAHASIASSARFPGLSLASLYVRIALAAIAAAVLLIPGVPLRGLHIYSADYIASFLALAGLILLALLPAPIRARAKFDRRAHFAALVFALVALFAFGYWLNWQITSFLPNATRAWRILPLALVTWPYFAAEELALNAADSPTAGHPLARHWFIFISIRSVLLGVLILGYFGFANGEFLPILISPFMFVISCGQRWGSDLLRARTGSIMAGAAFNAILAAWFFAAVFPLQ
jgi:pimeloyl-ACP methyl ester carboxylesterase